MTHSTLVWLGVVLCAHGVSHAETPLARILSDAKPAWAEVLRVISKQTKCELKLQSWFPADQAPDRYDQIVLRGEKRLLGYFDNRTSQAEFMLAKDNQIVSGEKSYESKNWFITRVRDFPSWDRLQANVASKIRSYESPLFQSLIIENGVLIDQLLDRKDFTWQVIEDTLGNKATIVGKWIFADTKMEKPVGISFHRFRIVLDRQKLFQIEDIQCTWGKLPTQDVRRRVLEWQSVEGVFLPKRVSTDLIIDMNNERTENRSEVLVTFDDTLLPESEFTLERFGLAPLKVAWAAKFYFSLLLCIGIATLIFSVLRRSKRI